MLKIFKKFFLVNSVIILLSIAAVSIILSIFISNYLTKDKLNTLRENCEAIEAMVYESPDFDIHDSKSVPVFKAISNITDADVFIADLNGKILACSCDEWHKDGLCEHNTQAVSNSIMTKVLSGKYETLGDMGDLLNGVHFVCGAPLTDSYNNNVGAVFSIISPSNVRSFYNSILRIFLLSAILPIIIMFFCEYFFSYRLIRPLKLMADASRSMAKGDFSKRIPVTGNDEIGELAVAFNQMTNSLVQIEGTRRRFIGNISHELKTPITTIGGFIDGIIDGTIPREKQDYYLKLVSDEIKRLSRLVQSMLNLSKLESGEHQINYSDFDICDVVFSIVLSQEQRIEKNKLNIVGLEDFTQTTVYADRDLIYQVVYNLVDNAVKFTNEGGTISFAIEKTEKEFCFKIRNTGYGIAEKELPFIFERFYKADRSRSAVKDSTGLGLYLANTIIAIHGGKISVQSRINDYTEFSFRLPNKNIPNEAITKNKKSRKHSED